MALSSQYVLFIDIRLSRNDVLNTYRAAPVRLLLGTGPTGLHQVQNDDLAGDVGAGQLPDVEHMT